MKKYFYFIPIIVIAAGVLWYSYKSKSTEPKTETLQETPTASAVYACKDGKTIHADFYKGENIPANPGEPPIPTGKAHLKLSDGREMTLPQTISASGVRYANQDESLIFWNKGDTAFITENSAETYSDCLAPEN